MANKWRILLTVCIGAFMAPLDASIVNISLPEISRFFNLELSSVEWVVSSYLIIISSLLLSFGRLGDIYGHKHIYVSGFIIFTLGSLLCAISVSFGFLIVSRIIQALGAGMLMAVAPAIISSTFPITERGKALGFLSIAVASGLAVGPVLGGILVKHFGWPSIFMVNLPIGALAIYFSNKNLVNKKLNPGQRFDYLGALSAFAALVTFLLALNKGGDWGWTSVPILGLLALWFVLISFFIYWELRFPEPMMDLSLFKNRVFSASNASALLNYISQYSVIFLMPFYLQNLLGLSADKAGILLLPMPLTVLFIAPASGILSDKIGSRMLSSVGMLIVALSLFLMGRFTLELNYWIILLPMFLSGLGSGLFQTPNSSALLSSVPKERLGIASGMMATMRNVGMVIGVALTGAIFSNSYSHLLDKYSSHGLAIEIAQKSAYLSAIHNAFYAGAIIALLGAITSLVRGQEAAIQKAR